MPTASVQQSPNQSGGKGIGSQVNSPAQQPTQSQQNDRLMNDFSLVANTQQSSGKGGRNYTMPGQGGQPRMGQPNAYSNTIQPWDNASIQPQRQSGKGKGY